MSETEPRRSFLVRIGKRGLALAAAASVGGAGGAMAGRAIAAASCIEPSIPSEEELHDRALASMEKAAAGKNLSHREIAELYLKELRLQRELAEQARLDESKKRDVKITSAEIVSGAVSGGLATIYADELMKSKNESSSEENSPDAPSR